MPYPPRPHKQRADQAQTARREPSFPHAALCTSKIYSKDTDWAAPKGSSGPHSTDTPQGLPGYSLFHLKLQFHRHSTFKVNLSFKEKRSGLILPRLARISRARSEERFNISLRQVRALSTWTYCLLVHEHELITIYVYLWKSV